ncbi:MAG: hypothetical protein AB1633_02110, partial [Elusimicrobiota bacterium]
MKTIIFLTFFILIPHSILNLNMLYAYWEENVMQGDINENFIPLAIGDSKNDGKNRIYGTEFQTRDSSKTILLEYNWNGSIWDKTVIFSTFTRFGGFSRFINSGPMVGQYESANGDILFTSLIIGDAHNDGKNRIYAAHSYFSDGLNPPEGPAYFDESELFEHPIGVRIFEFTWTGSSWTAYQINTDSISFNGSSQASGDEFKNPVILRLGDGRNDGKNRLYIGTGGSEVWEYTWSGSSLSKTLVTGPMTTYEIDGLIISDGRNDGVNRLYVKVGGYSPYTVDFKAQSTPIKFGPHKLAEYTWNSTLNKWDEVIISSSSDSDIFYGGLFIDDARNDGIKRVYTNGLLSASAYNMGGWQINDLSKIVEYTFNNNTGKWEQNIFQYTIKLGPRRIEWEDGSISLGSPDDFPNFFLAALVDARGDGKKRIYVDYGGVWKNEFRTIYGVGYNRQFIALTVPHGEYQELTWNGSGFDTERVPVKFIKTFLAGKARNDGVTRAYSAAGIEYTYNKTYSVKASAEYLVPINNYFNPLKQEKAIIICKLTSDGNLSVKIYNLNGKFVYTL